MKILYLACGFDGGFSGISVYMRNTMLRLAEAGHELTIVTTAADRPLLPELEGAVYHVLPPLLNRPLANMLYSWLIFPFRFSPKQYDFLLLPAANRGAPGFHRFFTVAVVHDLSQYHVKSKYDLFRMCYIKSVLPYAVRKAERVIAISGSTAEDLKRFWKIDPARIRVNFNGYGADVFHPEPEAGERERIMEKYQLARPFILYISRIEHPGKNHLRLIQAYEKLPEKLREKYDLVLGGSPWSGADTVFDYVEKSACRDKIRFIGFVDSADLPAFYRSAHLYICPSLFEGFGLPVPEAMACGTVVACSDNSSLGEIAGNAAELFSPESVPEIARAMGKTLCDTQRRRTLRERGFKQVRLFSWKHHAEVLAAAGAEKYAPRNTLLGITYDNITMKHALDAIRHMIVRRGHGRIAFVNADCFNQGWKNHAYRDMLTHFDYVLPDGSGIAIAGKLLHAPIRENVNGTDMLPLLAEMAEKEGFTIYLHGARPGVADAMRENLLKQWKNLKIVGTGDGYSDQAEAVGKIAGTAPDILLVALGVPRQEAFILENFQRLNCRVALGVGGLFDFYSGRIPRAPRWMRRVGMEWFFRFLMEPRRMFRRYIIGNPVFLYRTVRYGKSGGKT